MRMMRRQLLYLMAVGVTTIGASIWYFPNHTWTIASQDGYSDTDKGRSVGMITWKSLAGARIDEISVTYTSPEDARKDFDEELKDSERIIELTKNERLVKVMGDPKTRQGAATIIRLRDKSINYINAGSVKYALAFEEPWLKPW
jgi:hypothetical protein